MRLRKLEPLKKQGRCYNKGLTIIPLLFFILLLEGFVTISIEILTIRQLLPFFGGSVIITSMIIGVFLLCLALGYWRGAKQSPKVYQQLIRNFSFALITTGIGLSYVVVAVLFHLSVVSLKLPFLMSLCLYLILVLAPIVYWLGQTIPLTTHLFNQSLHVSRISGYALFISTLGSFLGAVLTSLVLFQYVGVAWTLVINCCILLLMIVMLSWHSNASWLNALIMCAMVIFIAHLNLDVTHRLFQLTNNYGNYSVTQLPDFSRVLEINNSLSSKITPDKEAFHYIEVIRNLLFNELQLEHKKILVIGAGGFTLTAAGTHNNDVTYLDIDPSIEKTATSYFLQAPIKGKFIGQDVRAYLAQSNKIYDVIIADAYSNQTSIPAALLTLEYFRSICAHLSRKGLFLVNIIANPWFGDDYARKIYTTLHAVFPYCAVIPLSWNKHQTNVIYVCTNQNDSVSMYLDDKNTATLDYFNANNVR